MTKMGNQDIKPNLKTKVLYKENYQKYIKDFCDIVHIYLNKRNLINIINFFKISFSFSK